MKPITIENGVISVTHQGCVALNAPFKIDEDSMGKSYEFTAKCPMGETFVRVSGPIVTDTNETMLVGSPRCTKCEYCMGHIVYYEKDTHFPATQNRVQSIVLCNNPELEELYEK